MISLIYQGGVRLEEFRLSTRTANRILCLTSNFPRWEGDSTTPFVLNLACDLQKLGWCVDVLAPHAPGSAKREVLQGIEVERFQYLWPAGLQSVCYQGGALVNLRGRKSNYLKLPAFVLAQTAALVRKLAGGRYDLIHSHWLLPQGFAGAIGASLGEIPHVVTIHGSDVFGLQGKIYLPFKRFALRRALAVTVNSSATMSAVRTISPGLDTLRHMPMGIRIPGLARSDSHVLEIRQRYRKGNGPLIIFLGRIVEQKGLEDLIRAVPLLYARLPDATVLVVGEGPHRPEMERMSKQLGITDRISFTGWVNPEMVPVHLAAADVFAGPSRRAVDGCVEAQGLSFLEAMSAGTPVIATRTGGIVDSVVHEETGLLVDERSPEQIAEAIIRLHADRELAGNLAAQGRKLVEQSYSREVCAARFSEVFDGLIK